MGACDAVDRSLRIFNQKGILELMPPIDSEHGAISVQLERILASAGFARNERLSGFLRFVVERHLSGRDNELKETVIATEVFGRLPDYNPKQDAVVRTEAGRLRARLAEYYLAEGTGDPLVIELPKGGYVPAFRHAVVSKVEDPNLLVRKFPRVAVAAAMVCMAISLAGMFWWWVRSKNAPVTIAVLPLENLNHDPAYDYLADGLTDELIRNLYAFDGLSPRSRTSSFALKGKPRNIRESGKELGAEYIVEGSLLRSGHQLRINAQLVRVRDDVPIWSGKFDREASDVLAIQDEISRAIVNHLRIKLGRGRRRYETSPEAYDLYLRARASDWRERVGPFQEAIVKDPSFAPAYAGLAATYSLRTGTVYFDSKDELIKMRAAAEKAIELDPLLAEAQDALGMACARDGQWSKAETAFRRAIELEPNRSLTHENFATNFLLPLKRTQEALVSIRMAQSADPLSARVRMQLSRVLLSAHSYDEAAKECEKLVDPSKSECLGRARFGQGRIDDAVNILAAAVARGVPPGDPVRGYLAYGYARIGRRDEAERIAETDRPNPFHQVLAFTGLGDKDRAFEALDRMAPQGPLRIGRALANPELDTLRGDPRAKVLRKKVGLPE